MTFEGDAFISYAHLDNQELIEGRKGWVSNLHRALEVRVGQLLGKSPHIWRDAKLTGNDIFSETIVEKLRRVAILVSVISPRYVKSDWTRRELSEFWKAAEQQGGFPVRDKARVFKVLKTPVPLEAHPPELQGLLGYEFFKVDAATGRVLELDEIFGPEAQRDFWLKLDDLAHDICNLLEALESPQDTATATVAERQGVYLAFTSSDLAEERESIKRDLQQHGYPVLPAHPLPLVASEVNTRVRSDLAQCGLSVHLIGRSYGVVPEGGNESLIEIQNELAIERALSGDFSRLVWIPPGLQTNDERQRGFLEHLHMDSRPQTNADLLETHLDELRTLYQEKLKKARTPIPPARQASNPATGRAPAAAEPESQMDAGSLVQLYLIHDERDAEAASPWADCLFDEGVEVIRPVFEGDEGEIREYHEENLCTCDAVLILYGAANELWLRRKLRELQKTAGYGRTKPMPLVAISLLPPKTTAKQQFRTHEAIVIPQFDGFSSDALRPFTSRLKPSQET